MAMLCLQVVATGWNQKVLVWQDEEEDVVAEYRMFSGHKWVANHLIITALGSVELQSQANTEHCLVDHST